MENSHFRFYVKVRCILGISPKNIWEELSKAFGKEAPSYAFVVKWNKLFKDGREDVKDNPRSGRPITALTQDNIELVSELIKEDPYITYDQIEAQTSLNPNSINTIIHSFLKLKKVTSRWVPHLLSEENKRLRVEICMENLALIEGGQLRLCDIFTGDESWFYHRKIGTKQSNKCWIGEGQSPKTIVRRQMNEPKTMFCIFFRSTGLVHITYVEEGRNVDSEYYIRNCLAQVISSINTDRPNSGTSHMRLLHDNATPHIAKNVKNYLETKRIKTIRHPPYSSDLAPCDFWLFSHIKQQLTDQTDAESMKKAITKVMKNVSHEDYLKAFKKWIERMKLCIIHKGEYFEHTIN